MKNIVFENVKKAYGKNVVVEDLCMEVKEGERLILLGPSGCGKSTTLRMIAGLENVTAGNLWMRDQVVNDVPCGERGVSMVFQNYALFPHMSVKNNIIYGLKAHKMDENEIVEFEDPLQETAFVITTGDVEICWNGKKELMHRESLLDENPYCLHVPHGVKVVVKALKKSELLIQKTLNDRDFEPVFYRPKDVQADVFGGGVWQGTAERTVRTIFDYDNAPYSNMVNGEVIMTPGCWTGYTPHNHPQPEVYTYKVDRPQGFGCAFIGDNVFKIEDNTWSEISGGYMHPQCAAPGYAIWYSWMIRHLDGDPWKKTRNDLPEHTWLLEPDADSKIWQPHKK